MRGRSAARAEVHRFIELQNDLPRTPGDYDIATLRDVLFMDRDVLMMFDPSLDGIEDYEEGTERRGCATSSSRRGSPRSVTTRP